MPGYGRRWTNTRCAVLATLLAGFLSPSAVLACPCDISLSACDATGASNLVFAGKVISIEPAFLSRWNRKSGTTIESMNRAYAEARDSQSPEALADLKATFLNVLPALPAGEKQELEIAATPGAVITLFNSISDRGLKVKFKVLTLYKHSDDDDDKKKAAKDDDDDKTPETLEVSTPFGDCGFDFQPDESYLVYASGEEGASNYSTGSCTRTKRLSDAGDDLTYLFFLKQNRAESSRIEGFATTEAKQQIEYSRLRNVESVASPATGAVIELQSEPGAKNISRDVMTDARGRFVFDGLAEGEYVLNAWGPGYPLNAQSLGAPVRIGLGRQSCARRILLLRRPD